MGVAGGIGKKPPLPGSEEFGISPLFSPDHYAGNTFAMFIPDGKSRAVPFRQRIFKQWAKADTFRAFEPEVRKDLSG